MDATEFEESTAGRLVRVTSGPTPYWAFIPNALPPSIDWTAELISKLSAADRALGQLAGVGRNLPNPHLLIGPFKRREAVLSSRIEGTQASLSDLLLFEAIPDAHPPVADVREVANYVEALEYGLARQTTLPMSLRLIREMHARLMAGVRGRERTPGEFRRAQNWIGPPGCTVTNATFVPPPPHELSPAMDRFEEYLHAPSDLPPLVRLALIHYQFEALHPFLDGNGRIGRLLITLLLCMEAILPGPLLYLSVYFERYRSQYYEGLLRVSRDGAWSEWIDFFLRGAAEQAMDAVERADRLLRLREEFHQRLHAARRSALLLKLTDELFAFPATTISRTAALLEVTPAAAHGSVTKLVQAGILREATGRKRNRIWVADQIRQAIE